jgi:glycosyltransferase involved in cell wall biosynthesis
MIKVFHIITSLDVGGAERVAINIAKSKNKDIEYHIVEVIRGKSDFTQQIICELNENGIKYHRSLFSVPFRFHYLFERLIACLFPLLFFFLWLRYRPEVIHTHTEIPNMATWLSLKLMPWIDSKIVRTVHSTKQWFGMHIVGAYVEQYLKRKATNISISKNVEEAYYKVYNAHTSIIYNGISTTPQIKYDLIKDDKINIYFAGRFEEEKGISTLCEIIKTLKENNLYYFHIIGSGRLYHLFDSIKGQNNVSINPPLHGISAYLSSFDYLIMPSIQEGLSILALEASFNGLPVMINHCAGLYDTLPDNWPLSVRDNNMTEWLHLFNDVLPSANRASLARQARSFVEQRFSIDTMQEEYMKLYTT